MDQAERKAFATALLATAEIYGRDVSNAVAGIYFEDLERYSLEAVMQAFSAHRRDPERGQYFPKPADLIRVLEGTANERAAIASSEARRLASNSREAKSSDQITEQVVHALGGWSQFGYASERDLGFLIRDFERLYAVHAQRGSLERPRLTGNVVPLIGRSSD